MGLQYHPSVRQDVVEATQRYKAVSQKLASEFKRELRRIIAMAAIVSYLKVSASFWFGIIGDHRNSAWTGSSDRSLDHSAYPPNRGNCLRLFPPRSRLNWV